MTTFDREAARARHQPTGVPYLDWAGGTNVYQRPRCSCGQLVDECEMTQALAALASAEGRLLAAEAMAATVEHATNVVMPKLHAAEARIAALEQSLGELLYGVERLGIPEVDRARALLSEPRP